MGVFTYKARDWNGLLVSGEIEGDNMDAIKETLADQGLIPITVTSGAKKVGSEFSFDTLFQRVSSEELMLFNRQFQTLFKAGMDMESLLSTLANQTQNKFFKDTLTRIRTDVAAGSALSRAFMQHPKVFDELYCNMLATGEEAGILDEVFSQLSSLMEKELSLKASVKAATLYPKIVVCALFLASFVMMTFVIPKFSTFYGSFGAELPLPTRILMGASAIFSKYWYMVIAAMVAFGIAFKKWHSTTKGKIVIDQLKWKLPVFGPLGKKVANARFANILGALYRAGLPVTRALEITAKTVDHEIFKRDIMTVKLEVEKGRGIAEAMRGMDNFNGLIVEATAIGERSGSLDEMYKSIGSHYDAEVQHTLKNLTTLIEPIMLGVVFGMIALFALAIFLPMFNIGSAVFKKN